MSAKDTRTIAPADGKLGVLLVGLGAVATTYITGVENVRRRGAVASGSLAELGTIRLGKRTDQRAPKIREFVPLAKLDDLVFGAWDPIPDDAYQSAKVAGVLEDRHIEPIADFLKTIKPMPAVISQHYVKRLQGTNVKQGKNKRDLAEQLRGDIRDFKKRNGMQPARSCGALRPRSSSSRVRPTRAWRRSKRRWTPTIQAPHRRPAECIPCNQPAALRSGSPSFRTGWFLFTPNWRQWLRRNA